MPKRKICPCGVKSVPGLKPGIALCQKHFNGLFYASTDSKEHSEAVTTLHKQSDWAFFRAKGLDKRGVSH